MKARKGSASGRVAARRARVTEAGGRVLYVVLGPKAAADLAKLQAHHGSITRAVEAALAEAVG